MSACHPTEGRGRSARGLLFFALALAVPVGLGCEERFSANPPPVTPESLGPASSTDAVQALIAGAPGDAGAGAVDRSRALTVTLCSSSGQACPDSGADGSYHVVFGSGRGAVRTRGQAMADLYKELRDRTASGEHLDAEAHAPGDGGTSSRGSLSGKPTADSDDALTQCAFQLLDLVDGVGEVTLDVVHAAGTHDCQVSLGRDADGGFSRCFVKEPERQRRPGRR